MLKGGLETEPLRSILIELGESKATGCLQINDVRGEEGLIYLKDGLVYSVSVSNLRPALGARLLSSGTLTPDALADAMEAQRFELRGWRLGELLVHLGYVEQAVVERYVDEQVNDGFAALLSWPIGTWKFRNGRRTREDIAPSRDVADLLAHAEQRNNEQAALLDAVHGPRAVPTLSATSDRDGEITLEPDAWSLLCKIDGTRSITELAHDCGFTLLEAGQVIHTLVLAGLVDIDESVEDLARPVAPTPRGDQIEDRAAALIAALSGSGPVASPTADTVDDAVDAEGDAADDPEGDADDDAEGDAADDLEGDADDDAGDDTAVRREATRLAAAKELADAFSAATAEREPTVDTTPLADTGLLAQLTAEFADSEAERTEQAELTTITEPAVVVPALVPAAAVPSPTSVPTSVPALVSVPAAATEVTPADPSPESTDSDDLTDSYDPAALASASALLAEFNRLTTATPAAHDAPDEADSTPAPPEPAAIDADQPETAIDEAPPRPPSSNAMADTASLLRELSSLGLDDSAAPAPASHGMRPLAPAQPKKRKGLFGR